MNENKNRWDTLWKTHRVSDKITRFNLLSFYEIKKHINLSGLNTIEVGCGTGSLSLLFSQVAKSVTLLDYSENSLRLAKELFQMRGISNCSFAQDDLFDLHHDKKYDLVISSGLLEHFKGKELLTCLNAHKYLAKKNGYVVIIAPSDTWFNAKRCHDPENIKLYGYWRPISKEKMQQLFNEVDISPVVIKRFDLSYGLKPWEFAFVVETLYYKTNLYTNFSSLDNLWGGAYIGYWEKTLIGDFMVLIFGRNQT